MENLIFHRCKTILTWNYKRKKDLGCGLQHNLIIVGTYVRNETMHCKINDGQFSSVGVNKLLTLWYFEKNKYLKTLFFKFKLILKDYWVSLRKTLVEADDYLSLQIILIDIDTYYIFI